MNLLDPCQPQATTTTTTTRNDGATTTYQNARMHHLLPRSKTKMQRTKMHVPLVARHLYLRQHASTQNKEAQYAVQLGACSTEELG